MQRHGRAGGMVSYWRTILSWEVDRSSDAEMPENGKRVRVVEYPDHVMNYHSFTLQPGDVGVIVDHFPLPSEPTTIEVLWDDHPNSGYDPGEDRVMGWYIDQSDIEYID